MLDQPTRVSLGTVRNERRGFGHGGAAWLLGWSHRYAARLAHRPLSHRCRLRGWVLLRSKGHGATFGPSAGGIVTRLTLLMPALTLRVLAPPSRAGVSMPHVPLPRRRRPLLRLAP